MNKLPESLEEIVNLLSRLPTIGKQTALKIVLNLHQWDEVLLQHLGEKISNLKSNLLSCVKCGFLSDSPLCSICSDSNRNGRIICVVENIQQVISLEKTGTFKGKYHVLGGVIDLLNDVDAEKLNIESLKTRLQEEEVDELIIALGFNLKAEATASYLKELFIDYKDLVISRIALGLPFGTDLSYIDPRSIAIALEKREKIV